MMGDRQNGPEGVAPPAVIPGELERLRAVFDLVGDAVLILDAEGRFVEVNRAACERYGFSRAEMLSRHIVDIDVPEEKALAPERIRKAIAEGGAVFEATHQAKDGRPVPTEVNTRFVPVGKAHYFISVCRDLTERRRTEQYQALVNLAGGVAHNINNLMTVVSGYVDILLRSLPPADPAREAAEQIRAAANRAAMIARQLTSYSRRQFIVPKIAEIGACIAGMARALADAAGKGVALSIEPGPCPLVVELDLEQFGHALEELVANARDASPHGNGKIAIRWRRADIGAGTLTSAGATIRAGAYALVEVADNGRGIEKSMLPRIFDPFVSSKEFGRGLGLPSIYGFVKQSDGFVSVASSPGEGTTISLYFPLAPRAAKRP